MVPELMLPVMPAVRTHTKARKMGEILVEEQQDGDGGCRISRAKDRLKAPWVTSVAVFSTH